MGNQMDAARRIPKIFHFVWVGDETREPKEAIKTWKTAHPDWETRVYRNAEAFSGDWMFSDLIEAFRARQEWPGVADVIRWEALYHHGGMTVDADSVCLRPLPDWLLDCEVAACWDNTLGEGELLANGFVLARPKNFLIEETLRQVRQHSKKLERWSWSRMRRVPIGAWKIVGPTPFTQALRATRYVNFTALPSHFFLSKRRDGQEYSGGGPVFARHFWGSTVIAGNVGRLPLEDEIKAFMTEATE